MDYFNWARSGQVYGEKKPRERSEWRREQVDVVGAHPSSAGSMGRAPEVLGLLSKE
ncbi:hypothetical protein [Rhizobium ruizarguesonis]|uniref:hypothetical protein n=1 Tax=Rhizobium ruizarguesonis TaxID=2081791 RepID=UPI0013EF4995|nr:hypothetical protein [Rhizobium ruizarguesonis]